MVLCPGASAPLFAQEPPAKPTGTLVANPTVVQAGVRPNLTWNINYPIVNIEDEVDIEPPGTMRPKRDLKMEVRVLGASVKWVQYNSKGVVLNWKWVPTEAQIRSSTHSQFTRIFYNTQDKVKPSQIVFSETAKKGVAIDFAGRYYWENKWSTLFMSTNKSSQNVIALKNGDIPPTTVPLYQQPTISDFIKPYLDNAGRIKIGPMDVIYLMELTHTDKRDGGFDLQDLALLVTFKRP